MNILSINYLYKFILFKKTKTYFGSLGKSKTISNCATGDERYLIDSYGTWVFVPTLQIISHLSLHRSLHLLEHCLLCINWVLTSNGTYFIFQSNALFKKYIVNKATHFTKRVYVLFWENFVWFYMYTLQKSYFDISNYLLIHTQ